MISELSLTSLAALVVAISAAPPGFPTAQLLTRDANVDGVLHACTNTNWNISYSGGECANLPFAVGRCYNFQTQFNDTISSYGPPPWYTCGLFVDPDCTGDEFETQAYPGTMNVTKYPDKFSSFLCAHNVSTLANPQNLKTESTSPPPSSTSVATGTSSGTETSSSPAGTTAT
ncbi:hypothetical protein B0H14DRAFT_3154894 [Mycena olivaceomarginata]|nr:hypothetical protein B0H14DRAFT_3154894 [Mycena olivaceomarginata]